MAKIDFSKIENWETLTAEEKLAALEAYEYEDHSEALAAVTADRDRYKESNSKANSKLAEAERQKKAALSEEEKKVLEAEEELNALRSKVADLQKDKQVAVLVGKGYSQELAAEKVEALQSGDFDALAAVEDRFLTDYKKTMEKELVNAVPPPASGDGNVVIDYGAKAQEALEAGEYAQQAYFTRLAAEQQHEQK